MLEKQILYMMPIGITKGSKQKKNEKRRFQSPKEKMTRKKGELNRLENLAKMDSTSCEIDNCQNRVKNKGVKEEKKQEKHLLDTLIWNNNSRKEHYKKLVKIERLTSSGNHLQIMSSE
ncbi:41935_t:CDS:2 [Gigaspora margarita]|uniref:41935_t:CDS:1 n=1 Tax=Gigaspora margarita TaxID=4874 RepID=A0ABN7UG35_GIGMA|nr:41935_t:CDS:2 [Gigaspora margarita]